MACGYINTVMESEKAFSLFVEAIGMNARTNHFAMTNFLNRFASNTHSRLSWFVKPFGSDLAQLNQCWANLRKSLVITNHIDNTSIDVLDQPNFFSDFPNSAPSLNQRVWHFETSVCVCTYRGIILSIIDPGFLCNQVDFYTGMFAICLTENKVEF